MNKTKRTLIFSSAVMAVLLVVIIVSVSAAWFGSSASKTPEFEIGTAEVEEWNAVDISSGKGFAGTIQPAVAEKGYFLKNAATPPTGKELYSETSDKPDKDKNTGLTDFAQAVTVYFNIKTGGGTMDENGRLAKRLTLSHVIVTGEATAEPSPDDEDTPDNSKPDENAHNYMKDGEFYVIFEMCGTAKLDESGNVQMNDNIPAYEADSGVGANFVDGNPYIDMKLLPNTVYVVKMIVFFNKIDEECNPDLLDKNLRLYLALSTPKEVVTP